jgi:hypothetical protein
MSRKKFNLFNFSFYALLLPDFNSKEFFLVLDNCIGLGIKID